MRLLRWIAPLLAAAALPASSAAAKAVKSRCAVPRGRHTVARSEKGVVIVARLNLRQLDGSTSLERRWSYCTYRLRRFHTLVTETGYPGGGVDIARVERLALSGIYVAYATATELGGGRYGTVLEVVVTNLSTGRSTIGKPAGDVFSDVLLAPPLAAWITTASEINSWAVEAFDGRTGKTTLLDNTCPTQTCGVRDPGLGDPFDGLRLLRCVVGCTPVGSTSVWWRNSGSWRSAQIAAGRD